MIDPAATDRPAAPGGDPHRPRPIVLVVLDGFGIGHDPAADAIAAARMPVWRALLERWPHAVLRASEDAVGLPAGQMGNSEVGHLNLGTGQPVLQDLPRIDAALVDGSFFERPALLAACDRAAQPGGRLHLVSLIGPGGVHANDRHLVAVAGLAARRGVAGGPRPRAARRAGHAAPVGRRVHRRPRAAPRGRPSRTPGSPPSAAATTRWTAITAGSGRRAATRRSSTGWGSTPRARSRRSRPATPAARTTSSSSPTVVDGVDGIVRDGDAIVHANFRADRARQLVHALADPDFDGFDRSGPGGRPAPADLLVVTMTEYEAGLPVAVAFPPEEAPSLAEAASRAGWRQLHVAETEKYAHVTYFFNGGREAAWPGEERLLVPSPKVATYDLQPEMSAARGDRRARRGDRLGALRPHRRQLRQRRHGRPHGRLGGDGAARSRRSTAVSARVAGAVDAVDADDPAAPGAVLLVTADHGNADELRDPAGKPVTAHSLNPVPLLVAGRAVDGRRLDDGVLADVTPTILDLAGLPTWPGVAGHSLLEPVLPSDGSSRPRSERP